VTRRAAVGIPENDDETVENVETVSYVADRSVSDNLQQHFDGEQNSKQKVAVLEHLRQDSRLQHIRHRTLLAITEREATV